MRENGGVQPQLSIMVRNFAEDAESWEPALGLARSADRAGVDRITVSDHIVFGEDLDAYAEPSAGGTAGGRQPTSADGDWLEPLTLLSVIAGMTSHVRLATGILLAALRPAAVLAKQVATLDVLSAGRVDLGVGIGWQRAEYEVCGLEFERRGDLLDRTLEICHMLWTQNATSFDDGDLVFERIHAMPKPVQPGGVPIWVSGRVHARTLQRAARFGAGWIPWGEDAANPKPGIEAMRGALESAGRDPRGLQVQGTLPLVRRDDHSVDVAATIDGIGPLVEAGLTDLRVHHRWTFDTDADTEFLSTLVGAFREAVGRPAFN